MDLLLPVGGSEKEEDETGHGIVLILSSSDMLTQHCYLLNYKSDTMKPIWAPHKVFLHTATLDERYIAYLGTISPKKECLLSGIGQIRGLEAPARKFWPSFQQALIPKLSQFLLKSQSICMFSGHFLHHYH